MGRYSERISFTINKYFHTIFKLKSEQPIQILKEAYMSKVISFQELQLIYPTLISLRVRVHGGLYGQDKPFDEIFEGNNSELQKKTFPKNFSCTKMWGKKACTGVFDIDSSIHHALKNTMENYELTKNICMKKNKGMIQECLNMWNIEIQAEYESTLNN